jgi:SAM-dependent methyltransferase
MKTETPPTAVFEKIDTFEDWDRDYYHPLALRYYDRAVLRMLKHLQAPPGSLVLDAGCGPGEHSIRVARAGHRVQALDISATVLEEARRRAAKAGLAERIEFRQADLTRLDLPDAAYERVFCWGVIIHIPDIEAAVRNLVRIVRPGGRLALHVTNRNSLDYKLLGLARAVTGKKGLPLEKGPLGIGNAYQMHGRDLWVWRVDPAALTRFVEGLGLRRVARLGGEFTEIQRRVGGLLRPPLLLGNDWWHRLHLPAGPCITNLLVFEKPGSAASPAR